MDKKIKLSADFETTTDDTTCTRVWAWATSNIDNPNELEYGNSLDSFMAYCRILTPRVWFHNLKFDGNFILSWLFQHGYKHVENRKKLDSLTFSTLITDRGLFYSIEVMFEKSKDGRHNKSAIFYDSLKVLPMSVDKVAKGFNLPISKLKIDYKKNRPLGHNLTQQEKDYIKNDTQIIAIALNILFKQGLTKMTTASNAFHSYKEMVGKEKFLKYFPASGIL